MAGQRFEGGTGEGGNRRVRRKVSAGGVPFRVHDGRVQFALVRPAGRTVWVLPKGVVEPAERPEEAALREVQEETGLVVQPRGALGEIEYWFAERGRPGRVHKRVHHFLFEAEGGSLDDHDDEMAEARWFEATEALRSLTHANERTILERAIQATASLGLDALPSPSPPAGGEAGGEGG
jgi:8-oxo-dGTP pyrophosphatase MutT (NUDIX family)